MPNNRRMISRRIFSLRQLLLFQFGFTTLTILWNFIELNKITRSKYLDPDKIQALQTFEKHTNHMQARMNRIRTMCQNSNDTKYWYNLHPVGLIWSYKPKNIHYCAIPKVGCTFWKRFMLFVSGDYPHEQDIRRPTDIDRGYVHGFSYPHISITEVFNPVTRMLVSNRAFMFSRDPYTRLWSAYIDKFLLPDFWISFATKWMSKVRVDPGPYDLMCGNNLSFLEFLLYITMTPVDTLNEHFQPMTLLCSPCHVAYDVVGKLENFTKDSEYVLRRFGFDHLVDMTVKFDLAEIEIRTLTIYNFKVAKSIPSECADHIDVARRLWTAFQYNGYIYRHTDFPQRSFITSDFTNDPISEFLKVAFKIINKQREDGIDMASQKRTMMLEAYREQPDDLLNKITEVYKYDFEIFDYDKNLFKDERLRDNHRDYNWNSI